MNNGSINNKQIIPRKKKIPSWVLGIIAILLSEIGIVGSFYAAADIAPGAAFFPPIIVIVISVWGLIRAKKELQQSRKTAAVIGIMLCSAGLIFGLILSIISFFFHMLFSH